jgi:hypothetical protein
MRIPYGHQSLEVKREFLGSRNDNFHGLLRVSVVKIGFLNNLDQFLGLRQCFANSYRRYASDVHCRH